MSSLMASSAPGEKPHEEPQFSRAMSSALQDMGQSTPRQQAPQQKDSSNATMLSTSPPFREHSSSPEETMKSTAALAFGEESRIDLAGAHSDTVSRHTQHTSVQPESS